MSQDRVPLDQPKLLLTMFKDGKMCTVMAMWDETAIIKLFTEGKCKKLKQMQTFGVFVMRAKRSQPISMELAGYICDQWLKGSYIKVQSDLFSEWEGIDSIT